MGGGFLGFTLGWVMGFGLGIAAASSFTDSFWHTETIRRDLAIYCPETGEWAWVGECEATK